jgi:hypothetical protein
MLLKLELMVSWLLDESPTSAHLKMETLQLKDTLILQIEYWIQGDLEIKESICTG